MNGIMKDFGLAIVLGIIGIAIVAGFIWFIDEISMACTLGVAEVNTVLSCDISPTAFLK